MEKFYDSDKELLNAIGKRAEEKARPYLSWDEPYDEADFNEIWNKITSTKKQIKHSSKTSSLSASILNRTAIRFYYWNDEAISNFKKNAELIRRTINLSSPIKIDEIFSHFKKNGWINRIGTKDWFIYMPIITRHRVAGKGEGKDCFGYRFCRYEYIELSPKIRNAEQWELLIQLQNAVTRLSQTMDLNPVLTLASIMCDIPAYNDMCAILSCGNIHTIHVRHPNVPSEFLKRLYTVVRNMEVSDKNKKDITIGRWRLTSKRVNDLINFVDANINMHWKKRLHKWNEMYGTKWEYNDINSMRTVYYRAQKTRKIKGGGNSK